MTVISPVWLRTVLSVLAVVAAILLPSPNASAQCTADISPNAVNVCTGGSFTLTAAVGPLVGTITWFKDGVVVQNGGLTLTRSAVTTANSGNYTVRNVVTTFPFNCSATSAAVPVIVSTTLAITTQPVGQTVCEGSNVVFTTIVSGAPTNYQWRRNGVNLVDGVNANGTSVSGSDSASLTLGGVAPADGGTYTCVIDNACNAPVTSNAVLTVRALAAITANPVATSGCQGDTVNFSITASGNAPLTFQWRRNGVNMVNGINAFGTNVSGATTSSLTLTGIDTGDGASYSCAVTNVCNTAISTSATLTVAGLPVITNPPDSIAVCINLNASFTVAASSPGGGALTYQWQFNNVNIANGVNANGTTVSGATTPTLTLTSIAAADAGTYRCVVRNSCPLNNTTTSSGAVLTVNTLVTASSPVSHSACELGSTTFSITASGSPAPTLQWQFNGVDLADGAANGSVYSGVTTNTLTITSLAPAAAGTYRCRVSNVCNSGFTTGATLTVNPQVIITTQPIAQTVCAATNVTFTVAATGFAPITYQWRKDSVNLVNGVNADGTTVSGATTATLSLTSVARGDSGNYECIVTNPCDVDNSVQAALVVQDVQITTQPLDVTACAGTNAVFTIAADGTPAPNFQWQRNSVNLVNGVNANGTIISGATGPTLTLASVASADAGTYRCIVSNVCQTRVSVAQTLTVNTTPVITNPVAVTTCERTNATFSVTATGSPAPSFQWQRNGVNLVDGVNANGTTISGATTSTLTLTSVAPGDNGNYRCIATNSCGSDTSTGPLLTVNPATAFLTQPADVTACPGTNASFAISATGTGPITSQWRRNGVNLVNGVNANGTTVSGVTTTTLVLTSVAAGDAGQYTCVITGPCGTVVSSIANLVVGIPVLITTQPISTTQCSGANASFTVAATGTPTPTFQWQKNSVNLANGGNVSGATTATLTLANVTAADIANYRCVISTGCDTALSSQASLAVTAGTIITFNPLVQIVPTGSNAAFSANASGPGPITFQWQRNGVNLTNGVNGSGTITAGATTTTLSLLGVTAADSGNYRCTITTPCGTFNTTTAALVPYVDVGTVSDTTSPVAASVNLTPSGIRWLRFTTNFDAVNPDRYLDIHTLGSNLVLSNDTEIGVYRTDGTLVADIDDFGGTFLSLLSFGQIAPGRNYPPFISNATGANGPLLTGTYFLAVGAFNTGFNLSGFNVTSNSSNVGNASITFLTNPPAPLSCNIADIVGIGGSPPPDGLLTGDDFNAFIAAFANSDPLADVVGIGGSPPPDGLITGDDFNAYIAAFAAGCP